MQALASKERLIRCSVLKVQIRSATLWRERKWRADIKVRLSGKLSLHTFFLERKYAPLAQLVEQLTLNQWVPGSKLTLNQWVPGSNP